MHVACHMHCVFVDSLVGYFARIGTQVWEW